ncbi:hypothetical protein GCM10017744_057360 [Streptomyces antimycoticus]|uniref:PIN domain-containing protein n=2 Tax=Streptomyces TaxID=1883 RepID=A0A4D4KB96_9ACTN|nr:hypothetical protein SANT12839_044890 [Streptomyces antimycoticus]
MAEQEGELIVDPALPVVQIGVADAARLDLHHRFAGAGVRHHDRLDPDLLALAGGYHAAYLLSHDSSVSGDHRLRQATSGYDRDDGARPERAAPVFPGAARHRLGGPLTSR